VIAVAFFYGNFGIFLLCGAWSVLRRGISSATFDRYASTQRFLFLLLVLGPRRMRGQRSHTRTHPPKKTAEAEKPGGFFSPIHFQNTPSGTRQI
jgi:hypothetical protein